MSLQETAVLKTELEGEGFGTSGIVTGCEMRCISLLRVVGKVLWLRMSSADHNDPQHSVEVFACALYTGTARY